MIKPIKDLENIIRYNFKDKLILHKALTHKSYDNKNNNEKLEFLGDRVLGLIISKKLLEKYPDEKEGTIDKKFANLVNKRTCLNVAKKLNLKKFLYLGKSNINLERSLDKILSDCLEAIIGSIYLDGGLKSSEKFILSFWDTFIDQSIVTLIDSKTKLQEFSLKKYKQLPKYTFFKKSGPQHKPVFKTIVEIPESKKISGTGSSKKKCTAKCSIKIN